MAPFTKNVNGVVPFTKNVPYGKSHHTPNISKSKYYHWFRDGKMEVPESSPACPRSLTPDWQSQTLSTGICTLNSKFFQYAEPYSFSCDVQYATYAHVQGIGKAGGLYKLEKYLKVDIFLKGFQFCILLSFLYLFHGFVCFHFDWYVCGWHCKVFQSLDSLKI